MNLTRFFAIGLAASGLVSATTAESDHLSQEMTPLGVLPATRIIVSGGCPTPIIDGKPYSGMMRSGYNLADFAEFGKIGVHWFAPLVTGTKGFWEDSVWRDPETWDYKYVDDFLDTICSGDPQSRVILRVNNAAPEWWCKANPSETVHVEDANGKIVSLVLPPDGHRNAKYGQKAVPSWSSPKHLNDTAEGLARLVRHIESGRWKDRVIGYLLCSGTTGEWFEWSDEVKSADWSPANINAFREWLSRHYQTLTALQAAWGEPTITFENANPPIRERLYGTPFGSLRNPEQERAVIDYLKFMSERTSHAVERFAKAIKEAASRPVIVGANYGYTVASDPGWGHQNLEALLDSPQLDFFSSPTLYWEHRKMGLAAPGPMTPLGSLRLHGKYWISETDVRTSATGKSADWFQNKVADTKSDILLQRRELAWILTQGVGQWWFDVGQIRYDLPPLMSELLHLNKIAEGALSVSRAPEDHIAAVIDPDSLFFLNPTDSQLRINLRRLQLDRMTRTGMATACYSASDLERLNDKKMILFCDMIAPDQKDRHAIESLKSNGRVLVFLWAAGAVADNRISEASMEQLTGIKIRSSLESEVLQVTLNDCNGQAANLNGVSYGMARVVQPAFIADDPSAEVWGRLASGKPGLVIKKYRDWTAVYSSAPLLPPELLALLGRMAGAHQYLPAGDALWASKNMLGVNAFTPGAKTLRFEEPTTLYDLYEDRALGTNTQFTVEFSTNESKLFRK